MFDLDIPWVELTKHSHLGVCRSKPTNNFKWKITATVRLQGCWVDIEAWAVDRNFANRFVERFGFRTNPDLARMVITNPDGEIVEKLGD